MTSVHHDPGLLAERHPQPHKAEQQQEQRDVAGAHVAVIVEIGRAVGGVGARAPVQQRQRDVASKHEAVAVQIAVTGVRKVGETLASAAEPAGMPSSRAKAKSMRLADVTVARPQSSCAMKMPM